MNGYRFDRLSAKNLHYLVGLYKSCFGLKVDLDFLVKKYDTKAFGAEYIGYIAFDKTSNLPGGYYGVFPIKCKLNGLEILAAQSGDTMTHPDHRGKGLFIELAKATYSLAKQEGIQFIFGFPNKNSYPGFIKKLNWNHYNDINNYEIKTDVFPFDKLAKKFKSVNLIYAELVENKLNKIATAENVVNSLEKQNPDLGHVIHDDQFYQYKTYLRSHRIKINNVNCVVKVDGRLWVGDIEFCQKDEFIRVIEELIKLAKNIYCSSVFFSCFDGTAYDLILQERFPVKSKNPVGVLNLNENVTGEKMAYQAIDFDTF